MLPKPVAIGLEWPLRCSFGGAITYQRFYNHNGASSTKIPIGSTEQNIEKSLLINLRSPRAQLSPKGSGTTIAVISDIPS